LSKGGTEPAAGVIGLNVCVSAVYMERLAVVLGYGAAGVPFRHTHGPF